MSKTVRQRGRYDDTGEEVTIVRHIPQIEIRHSMGGGTVDGLADIKLNDGTQLTPHGTGKLKRVDNNRVITVIDC